MTKAKEEEEKSDIISNISPPHPSHCTLHPLLSRCWVQVPPGRGEPPFSAQTRPPRTSKWRDVWRLSGGGGPSPGPTRLTAPTRLPRHAPPTLCLQPSPVSRCVFCVSCHTFYTLRSLSKQPRIHYLSTPYTFTRQNSQVGLGLKDRSIPTVSESTPTVREQQTFLIHQISLQLHPPDCYFL